MEHYQIKKSCKICGRNIIADVYSVGTSHQEIAALTCEACAVHIMKEGETEELH